jgi:sugar lactone lactonase YvrE
LQSFLIILLIRKRQSGEANTDGKKVRAFRDEIAGKARRCIAVVKSSGAPMVGKLLLILVMATAAFCLAEPTGDTKSVTRARLTRIESLRKDRPKDGVLIFYEAITRLELGDRDAALALLRSLKGRKLGLVPVRDAGFEAAWNDPEFQKIREKLAQDEPRTPDAPVAFRLTDPKLIPEGIAYDPKQDRFFIGSVAQKKIVSANRKGEVKDFSKQEDNLDCVLGMFVDAAHEQLYAVSTNGFLDEAQKQRRNTVVRYDLKNGLLVNRYDAPDAIQLNDLTVAGDGTIYASDSAGGTLFRKRPAEKTLTPFGPKSALPGANGITLGADGSLYVAISTGIARIDLSTGAPTRLPQPDTVVTGGCDGLYWYKGDLVGIQNVTNPGRVIRIALSDQGKRISGVTVLQSHHHPEFNEPTTGAIAGDALYVVANSYVGHFQPNGSLKNPEQLKPTAILAVSMRSTQ